MKVKRFKEDNSKGNNFLVIENGCAILIDASVSASEIEEALKEANATLKAIFLTHSHFDHILNLDELVETFKVSVYLHKNGLESLYDALKNESGLEHPLIIKTKANIMLFEKDLEELEIDGIKIRVYHTPGHSSCSVCYEIGDNMFTGDTIFKGLIGRNDLWNSDPIIQQKTLRELEKLEPKECYYAGHGVHFTHDYLIKTINRYLVFKNAL